MRNKTFLLFILISAIHVTGIAQQDKIADSLLNVLKTQKEDTNRVNTLNALARNYSQKGKDSLAIKYANDIITSAAKLNYSLGIFRGYTTLGSAYAKAGNEELALKNHRKALEFAQQCRNKKYEAIANNNIGYVLHTNGHATEALEYYKLSAKLYEDIGDKRTAAVAYANIAIAYDSPLSNYTEAIKWYTISINLSKETGDKERTSYGYIGIGNCYESLGNSPEAIKNYLVALKISEETGEKSVTASCHLNIGTVYAEQGKYTEALKYFNDGLKVFEQINRKFGIMLSHDNIGRMHLCQGNFSEALKHHQIALKIAEGWLKDPYNIAGSYMSIGDVYSFQSNYAEALKNYFSAFSLFKKGLDNDKELLAKINSKIGLTYFNMNNFSEARKHLDEALAAAIEFRGKKIIADVYAVLARTDSAAGNWPQAYEAQKLLMLYSDSLLNEETSKKITENVMQYQFDKKEDSLKLQQAYTDQELLSQTLLTRQQQQALLLKGKELILINNEKQLQELQFEKHQADFTTQKIAQKADADSKQGQLLLLNKEKDIQTLELNKQKILKNYLLAGIALLGILSFFVYKNYRTRQKLNLQTLRNKIASDLHDDVGSTLSSISIFSQMAQEQSKEVNPLLDTIGESSRKMLDAMADIVWTINPENDQFEKIILRMRSFAYELLGARKIDFEFVTDDYVTKINVPMNVRKNLYLIFKEATNNMVKYAAANRASFSVKGEKNNLIMIITDNGKGFDTSQASEGNGLKNMKKRAGEIRGQLLIESWPGKGTEIQLRVAV
jgi:two-component system sensor histidine kinase UhpB